MAEEDVLGLTAEIVSAYVTGNSVFVEDLPGLIGEVHKTLSTIGEPVVPVDATEPAVAARKSVFPEYLVCLGCGKHLKMLKRHLLTAHDQTVAEYRVKWGLPLNYPTVAPNYTETRSKTAKQLGFGRPRPFTPPPKTRGRPPGRKAAAGR
jgi:predicted transcriptional regulator